MQSSRLLTFLLFGFCTLFLAPEVQAQKNSSKYREFPAYGFEFKPLKGFLDIPSDESDKAAGVIGTLKAERGPLVKTESNQRLNFNPKCVVIKIDPKAAVTDGSSGGGLRGRANTDEAEEIGAKEYIKLLQGASLRRDEFKLVVPEVSTIKAKGIQGKREIITTFVVYSQGAFDVVFDCYTFQLPDYKILFIWDYPADKKIAKKWSKAVEKSMKSFRFDMEDREISSVRAVNSESNYEDLLEFHQNDVDQTPGWRLLEVPSKQYLIKTNSDDNKNLKKVIKRLEASRRLFEEDFPPSEPITSVSVVRLCATSGDFQAYGDVGNGVAGFFSPRSEELVLYFGEGGTAMTFGVMTHEAFHQYCHFLFNRSEAHRWFDEGHGDYYGAWKMRGSNLVPEEDMKGGLARTPEIKRMHRNGTIKPLKRHIRYDHGEWQSQGPSNVSCYAQSFSLIYFLREGARGKVKKKYWKEEYADILPNYIKHLNDGYKEAYAEIVSNAEMQLELLKDADADFKILETQRDRIKSPWDFLGRDMPQRKQQIWDKAMAESWGKIDELELEDRWLEYIDDVL
ncbi:MAG: hypothetical protein COA70_11490 [Planctomycetota bacterium]|nr:MAG: hypothetical protein COA70_11490 [Planctomycetota bacterium]